MTKKVRMASNPLRRRHVVIFSLLAVIVCGPRILDLINYHSNKESLAREELKRFYDALEPGSTLSTLTAEYSRQAPQYLTLDTTGLPERVVVATPANSWADNWLLWIHLSADKVECIGIRILDDSSTKPFDAPPDKIASDVTLESLMPVQYIYRPFWGYRRVQNIK